MAKINKLALKLRELGEANDYKAQGDTFLKDTGTMIEVLRAVPQSSPRWAKDGKHGICYSVTLAKPSKLPSEWDNVADLRERGYIEKEIQFLFWNSIAEKEKAEKAKRDGRMIGATEKKPDAYHILAALYSPCYSFEDFCATFGYSEDSREAERTYNEVKELNAKLESLYTPDQLEAMQEIS